MIFPSRHVLAPMIETSRICGYEFKGYSARITDMVSYFEENMKLLNPENLRELFDGTNVYTTVRDDNPARYCTGSKVSNSLIADGCVIEGEVENCVLFRGVHVGKGTRIRNCILMQDTVISGNCDIEYTIMDKEVSVASGKSIKGERTFPVFVPAFKKIM